MNLFHTNLQAFDENLVHKVLSGQNYFQRISQSKLTLEFLVVLWVSCEFKFKQISGKQSLENTSEKNLKQKNAFYRF